MRMPNLKNKSQNWIVINGLKYLNGNLILDFKYTFEVQNLELKMIPINEKFKMN